MFWGLVLEPSKRYTQKVQQSFHISQASLELSTSDLEPIQLILEYDGANYVLATLSKKSNVYQVPLDLNFNAGDQISFRTIGKGRVHLTGIPKTGLSSLAACLNTETLFSNVTFDPAANDCPNGIYVAAEAIDLKFEGYHILEDDLEDMMLNGEEESDVEEEEETDNSIVGKQQTKRKKPDSSKSPSKKKSKLNVVNEAEASDDDSDEDTFGGDDSDLGDSEDEELDDEDEEEMEAEEEDEDDDEEESEDEEDDDEEEVVAKKKPPASASKNNKADASMNGKMPKNKKMPDSTKGTPKSAKKSPGTPGKDMKENKTPKSEKKSPKSEKKGNQDGNKSQESSLQKKVLEGGVIIEELRVGEGQIAKPGRMAQVYYVGRLQSTKKQFDATTQGPGFKFRLGRGEVIKGWDIGVNGMKVGGKRRITIPAQLAYGVRGSPPAIPPNSTLVFEVELKGLN